MDPIAQWWAELAEHAAARGFQFRKRGRGPQADPGVLDVHIPAPALVDEHTDDRFVDQLRPLVAAIRETDPWRSTRPPTVVVTRLWLSMLINPLPVWPTPAVPISWGSPWAWSLGALDDHDVTVNRHLDELYDLADVSHAELIAEWGRLRALTETEWDLLASLRPDWHGDLADLLDTVERVSQER